MSLRLLEARSSSRSFVPVDALKQQLSGEAIDDTALCSLLEQATALLVSAIGRPVVFGRYQESVRIGYGEQRQAIALSVMPLHKVKSIAQNGIQIALQQDDAGLSPDAGLLYAEAAGLGVWQAGRYDLTYWAGWVLPDTKGTDGSLLSPNVPADLCVATLSTARSLHYAAQRGDPLLRSESEQGVGSTSWTTPDAIMNGLPPDAFSIVSHYKNGGIA